MRNHFSIMTATNLIGNSVLNSRGEDLGRIRELVIDAETGQISAAILSSRDPWTGREQCSTVPWKELTVANEEGAVYADEDILQHPFRREMDWTRPVKATSQVTVYTSVFSKPAKTEAQ